MHRVKAERVPYDALSTRTTFKGMLNTKKLVVIPDQGGSNTGSYPIHKSSKRFIRNSEIIVFDDSHHKVKWFIKLIPGEEIAEEIGAEFVEEFVEENESVIPSDEEEEETEPLLCEEEPFIENDTDDESY